MSLFSEYYSLASDDEVTWSGYTPLDVGCIAQDLQPLVALAGRMIL